MKRAIIIVIDGLGVGALPDAPHYGDAMTCNTLVNVARSNPGLKLPNLQKMGLGNIIEIEGIPPATAPVASYGRMREKAKGKDSTTGHWELAGFVLDRPFPVYPNGFPTELIDRFLKAIEVEGCLGNCPASGTDIIEEHHEEHSKTGYPIIYTSADSVFQIASNVDVVPLSTLYQWCETAREMLCGEHNVSRVIARPYQVTPEGIRRLSSARHDYGVKPTQPTLLNRIANRGGRVIAIGKIGDLFVDSGITHSVHTESNLEGIEKTIAALNEDLNLDEIAIAKTDRANVNGELVFINLVDTDTQFGHRRDPVGYGKALEEIDRELPRLLGSLKPDDLLIITSDHGNDPTAAGSDHTREHVPLLIYSESHQPRDLGTIESFAFVAEVVEQWLTES